MQDSKRYETFDATVSGLVYDKVAGRKQLRWSISGTCIFSAVVLLISVIFASATYSYVNHSSPILISPYTISGSNTTLLEPCIFDRMNQSYSVHDVQCTSGGFCPIGWQCNVLESPVAEVCTNIEFPCPSDSECYKFVSTLPQFISAGIPVLESDVEVTTGTFVASLIIFLCIIVITFIMWIFYELWICAAGDPLGDRFGSVTERPSGGTKGMLADKYESSCFPKLIESSPVKMYLVITAILIPLMIVSFVALIVFITGISPNLPALADDTNCVNNHAFYEVTSALVGWAVLLCSSYLLSIFVLWILFAMYLLESAFKYWKPHIFFFACGLFVIVAILASIVEIIDAI